MRLARDEKNVAQRATPTGSLNSMDELGNGSPDQIRRGGSLDQMQSSDLPLRNGPPSSNPNASLYPWSQRRLTYTQSNPTPFPRYGAAVNATASKEGDIYMMGGLINSSTVKGDLWMIEAGGNLACYPLATTAEGPGPRVGHSSLLVGNAFIVYGGDTKIDESDVLDETLYLLNTSTRHWSRALPAGPRPSGRYGHSLNILGSKIYIFGGQVEGYFMNDLSAFDLNQLQSSNNRWEILLPGDTSPNTPKARTNHSVVTFNDKMYLFGGTNGFQWFNDVWCYDPATNSWTQLDCIGYIPAPREGHAAALVDDVMYVFGGRTEEGTDLGDLAAFRISSQRWYTFQNMGPSPSPRSGHSMTTVGKSIVVLGGEPSSPTTTTKDLGIMYVLDTTKIRYPNDNQQGAQRTAQGIRRPSTSEVVSSANRQLPPPAGAPQDSRKPGSAPVVAATTTAATGASGNKSPNGYTSPPPTGADPDMQQNSGAPPPSAPPSKLPRANLMSSPSGPPPQGPTPAKPNMEAPSIGRVRGASTDRVGRSGSPQTMLAQPAAGVPEHDTGPMMNGRRTPTQPSQLWRTGSKQDHSVSDANKGNPRGHRQLQSSVDSSAESNVRAVRPSSPPPPTRQPSNPLSRRSSGRNSQTVALLNELDSARNRNAWYASELELARKAGYVSTATMNTLDAKAAETFDDEDRPLVEALLAMRTELANVQSSVDKQAIMAAKQIAEAEKQRDAAIQEAVYAKAKLAAHTGGSVTSTPQLDGDRDEPSDRSGEMAKKLAAALGQQKDLRTQLDHSRTELMAEKSARQLADDTATAAQKRLTDLETYKQQTSTEIERLKAELHVAQQEAREKSVACVEAVTALELVRVERDEFGSKYNEAVGSSKSHDETFESLKNAISASEDVKSHLETRLEEERAAREQLEDELNKLKREHEARTTELLASTKRLRDAQELAEKHANEAQTHRQALLSGLGTMTSQDTASADKGAHSERIAALQDQITAAKELARKYQLEADAAADKLRSAEERIAGLEQYQEQSSREGVAIRRQLQSALRETQALQAGHTDLRNQLASQQLETNAMTVQHNALKDILSERGISPTSAIRSRVLVSPRTNSPEQTRMRDLEAQLASAAATLEECKLQFASQQQESELAYREKLQQLESDYQSAVHYVKGTEKMLKQLKDQLSRYKSDNGRLKLEIEELETRVSNEDGRPPAAPEDWLHERDSLHQRVESLESELKASGSNLERRLEAVTTELADSNKQRDEAIKTLESHRKDLEQLHAENALLEQRAGDAEQKVALLLDQVEHSVDNYRRRSRQAPSMTSESTNGLALGHSRNESSENGSSYGGANSLDARNSAALDNLASELETLRSHWEATNKNYRLSSNFDFDSPVVGKKADEGLANPSLSESLADWRKRLDTDDHHSGGEKP